MLVVIKMDREGRVMFFDSLKEPKTCSEAVFGIGWVHGKSPCFSRCGVFALVDVDYPSVDFAVVYVEEILE